MYGHVYSVVRDEGEEWKLQAYQESFSSRTREGFSG